MSALLSTDVLAVLSVDDHIFVGIGYTLHVYRKSTNELVVKLDAFYPDKIHGIVEGPKRRIIVFGGRNICIFNLNIVNDAIEIKPIADSRRLKDWIIAVGWQGDEDNLQLSILFAHNSLYLYNWSKKQGREFQSQEKCILYGGSVWDERTDDIVVFGGTVFQEIVIWAVRPGADVNEDIPVLHRLREHNGIIFSVTYDPLTNLISSTSDDRTVRLWAVKNKPSESGFVKWKNAEILLIATMFGHTARVWRAMIREKFVVSIGEDSLICIWSIKGELINKIEAHHGAAIWSIDITKECDTIITGGGDGAVYLWPFRINEKSEPLCLPKNHAYEVPKHVGCLKSGGILVIAEGGKILRYDKEMKLEKESIDVEKYSSYCVMQLSPCRTYIALASIDGYITLYKDTDIKDQLKPVLEQRVMESKIFSMQWLSNDSLLICAIAGHLKIVYITSNSTISVVSEHVLPPSRERWVTAAISHKNFLICGDRAGSIHVFRANINGEDALNHNHENPVPNSLLQTFPKIHGRLGVHSCAIIGRRLLTTGRDGTLRFYQIHESEELLSTLHVESLPMDWGSRILQTDGDLYVLGFKETEFVVYSTLHHRLLVRIPCGGGHRSWDCALREGILHFAYIRDKLVHLVDCPLSFLALPALLNGFHTKEVYCIQRLPTITGHNVLISGGEDRAIRLSHITKSELHCDVRKFKTLDVLDGHISNVKSLAVLNFEDTETHSRNLIFSGGGRAQLKVWEITVKFDQTGLDTEHLSCAALASHMLWGTDQKRRKPLRQSINQPFFVEPETRYMEINVHRLQKNPDYVLLFIACSDGFLRIFLYIISTKSIHLETSIPYKNRCILKTHSFVHDGKLIVLTMATDGMVNFWHLDEVVDGTLRREDRLEDAETNTTVSPFATLSLHQCGINSFDLKFVGESTFMLITGGDDNLLSFIVFQIIFLENGVLSVQIITEWKCASAHSTQITGLKFVGDDRFLSVGIDQQVMMFNYTYKDESLTVTMINEIITSVSDVQGMVLCDSNENDKMLICVYGKGFELINRNKGVQCS